VKPSLYNASSMTSSEYTFRLADITRHYDINFATITMHTCLGLNDLNGCLNGTIPGICQPTAHCSSSINWPRPALLLRGQWTSEQRWGGSSVAAVEMSRSDYIPLYLGPVTVVGLRLGDRFEVKLTSFEFWCFRADMRPKTKPKMLKHLKRCKRK